SILAIFICLKWPQNCRTRDKESTLFALSIERSLLPSKRKVEGKVNLSFEVTIIFSFKNGNSIKD
ncbi:hypothetical protein, partial [Geobacillus sp. PA-3]|uniref:hypothetical protein n=1 Tax=Geobacillus sp. PA-3 TaxID=1699078 RepID=UPI001ED99293